MSVKWLKWWKAANRGWWKKNMKRNFGAACAASALTLMEVVDFSPKSQKKKKTPSFLNFWSLTTTRTRCCVFTFIYLIWEAKLAAKHWPETCLFLPQKQTFHHFCFFLLYLQTLWFSINAPAAFTSTDAIQQRSTWSSSKKATLGLFASLCSCDVHQHQSGT